MKNNNVIITGVPRSGTTFLCKWITENSTAIALNEPINRKSFLDHLADITQMLQDEFAKVRQSIVIDGIAPARVKEGKMIDNAYNIVNGKRKLQIERQLIQIKKTVDNDFILMFKHCAEFTNTLAALALSFPTIALVRNPLYLLQSWNTVDIPVSKGKVALSEMFSPELIEELHRENNLLSKQIVILDWYFDKYINTQDILLLRYENLMTEGVELIKSKLHLDVTPAAFKNRNTSLLQEKSIIKNYLDKLNQKERSYHKLYKAEDIEQLFADAH